MDEKILIALQEIEQIKGAKVFEQSTEISDIYMRNCKWNVHTQERMVIGPFGELIETAPNTFVKSFPGKELLLSDLSLFKRAQFAISNTTVLQAPTILGYFTFDGNTWHLAFVFPYVMYGETNEMLYEGGVVNPSLLFPEINKIAELEQETKRKSNYLSDSE